MATKILYIITKSNWGGAQRYVYDLASQLPPEFAPAVVLGGDGALRKALNENSIRVIALAHLGRDVRLWSDIKTFVELIRIFRHERPDIVHLNSSKMALLGAPAARIARVPFVVFTAHGWPFNEERPRWQQAILRVIASIALLFPHTVIAVSHAVRNDIRHFPCIARKTVVIHNGIEPIAFKSRAESRAALMGREPRLSRVPGGAPWIGINAELHKSKGITYAIRAAGLLSKTQPFVLCIVGDGQERASLAKQITDAGLEDSVFLLGRIDAAATYLNAFDIFLLPSVTEALGYVLLEAGAAELPVIASRVGGIPEIIEDHKTGLLVPPRDPAAIARAIEFFLTHPDTARAYGNNLRGYVQKNFSIERMLAQTLALYGSSFST